MTTQQRVTPHLWFDTEAKEAAEFYVSIFPESKLKNTTILRDTPSGDCDVVSFDISGHAFMAIGRWPAFQIQPVHIVYCQLRYKGRRGHIVGKAS